MSWEFVGSGWGFPLRTDSTGGFALVHREQEIVESIRLILATAPGERPMRPDFGCGIHEFVFAPADDTTAGRVAAEVRRALERWEPRVEVDDVMANFDEVDAGTLYIEIRYQVRATNDPRSLVFPFYLLPDEDVA